MTLQVQSSIKSLYTTALLKALNTGFVGMSIYSGVPPTTAEVIANWALYNSTTSNFLVHYPLGTWTHPGFGTLLQLSTIPAAVAPLRDGTAAWAIIWINAPSSGVLAGNTLPSAGFMIVSVTDTSGNGVLRFADLNLVTTTPVAISDGTIGVSL